MYTPAATMVAAWRRAETGVGPAMAFGSQVWRGYCPDFPTGPPKSRSVGMANSFGAVLLACWLMLIMSRVLNIK